MLWVAVAIDVWSAGVIMLFFLAGKFPIFQSQDDMEALIEIATIIGFRKIEKVATLHSQSIYPHTLFPHPPLLIASRFV